LSQCIVLSVAIGVSINLKNNKVMKAEEMPEKIYLFDYNDAMVTPIEGDTTYVREDAFIEKALKWYCLDCECNGNCNNNCYFKTIYEMYLKGDDEMLPPKIENAINPDGSTSENYRYRHFTSKIQDVFIEKAAEWLNDTLMNTDFYENEIELMIEEFKKAMKL
jgi:hypothetical protein